MLFGFSTAFGQFNIGVGGAYQIVNAVSTFGREVITAAEYKKRKKEQQSHEAEYMTAIQTADSLFVKAKYREAIDQYNRALQLRQDEYAISQIGRANTELIRLTDLNYEHFLDTADAAYNGLDYAEAITYYQKALELKDEEYPKAKIERAQSRQELWHTVHFSNVLISDSTITDVSSQAFVPDSYSNFIPLGQYPVLNGFSWGAADQTPSGIAIPSNVRLVVYSEPYLKGKVVADILGPAIINNNTKRNQLVSMTAHSKKFSPALQQIFPQQVRSWSVGDMKEWYKGSMEIKAVSSE